MEVEQALAELAELSSQIRRAVILDETGTLLGSTASDSDGSDALAQAGRDLISAASELHAQEDVARVEVELSEGAVFVLREGGRTIVAATDPDPTAGLVVYDLRTCLHGIETAKPKRRQRKPKDESE